MSPHPQTVWDAAELSRLSDVRATSHKFLADNLRACLNRHTPPVAGSNVAGLAMMTRILGDQPADTQLAIQSLTSLCQASTWDPQQALDLDLSENVLNAAVGYDVLFDLLDPTQKDTCKNRIAAEAKKMADAADAGFWWTTDLVNNHNWVNFAAIGIAGQALEGEDDNAQHWQEIASLNFQKVKFVQDRITDGSWHEGIGYMGFGLQSPIAYFLGAFRRGSNDDKTNMLSKVGRYILYAQLPNRPRVHVMTHGDWNWSRPHLMVVLRWAAKRFQDPYAQKAAQRWDLQPRLTRPEFGLSYALEYAAYDPDIPDLDLTTVPLDVYNGDQQSALMRSSWDYGTDSPHSDPIVLGFKSGVFGGRGNYERMRNCDYPGGSLNFGHDHEDDLGLWIYGKGGWLLPEAVAYNCCYRDTSDYHSTPWHNTFLFDDQGQLGDTKTVDKQDSKNCGSNTPTWFYDREASMPLQASTDHYAFARGDGKRLYPSALNITTLLRTVGLSRENGGFIALQDRVLLDTERKVEQLFHSMTPWATENDAPWVKLTNLENTVLGIRILSPNPYIANITTQHSNQYQEDMDDDGLYGYVRVTSGVPQDNVVLPQSNLVFLEVLWPTKSEEWDNRPDVQPLDAAKPWRGFSVPLGTSTESWIYNASGTTTSAGDLTIQGTSPDDIGIKRSNNDGTLERVVVQGSGSLRDQNGTRILLDLATNHGALEVDFAGTRADLSGTAGVSGVQFYGPDIDESNNVYYRGEKLLCSRSGAMVIVGEAPSPSVVRITDVIYNPVGSGVQGEHVTLENSGNSVLSMSRWTLSDVVNNHQYRFPANFSIDPGAHVRIWTEEGTNDSSNLHWGRGRTVWNTREGNTVIVKDALGMEVDRYSYYGP